MKTGKIFYIKLSVLIVFVVTGGLLWQDFGRFSASAHDGHRHAPASAKKLKSPVPNTPENVEAGRVLYEENCAGCHGMNGKAQTETAARMKKRPTDLTSHAMHDVTVGEVYWVITNGIAASKMPDYKRLLTPKERWQTTLYVQSLKDGHESSAAVHDAASGTREVAVNFRALVGSRPFKCGESYEGIGATKSKITPTDFRLYVSDLRLIDRRGREVAVQLDEDGKWQAQGLACSTVPTSCAFPNRVEVTLPAFAAGSDTVVLDLKALLEGANVDANQEKTPQGCMSSQEDKDCAPLFANLGLSFAGQTPNGQRFIRAEAGAKETGAGKTMGAGN